jgi:PhzF family phenazine biosynthesis protein
MSGVNVPCYHVDAFTAEPFRGNPAVVCLLDAPRADAWLSAVAAEMNCPETAFVWPPVRGARRLRWFTPTVEVLLCGHATLATAHVLWTEAGVPATERIIFETHRGRLEAQTEDGWIRITLPALPLTPTPVPAAAPGLAGAAVLAAAADPSTLLLELEDGDAVRSLRPDVVPLGELARDLVIVTGRATSPGIDCVSRVFASRLGIPEDPVTGRAHCSLAPYWAERLGRPQLVGEQASARGGIVRMQIDGPRVGLIGEATTVLRAELLA